VIELTHNIEINLLLIEQNTVLIADLKEQQIDKSAYVDHLQNETDFIIKTKNFGEKLDLRLKAKILNCQKILKMQDDQIAQIASVRSKEFY
jgi:urease accessory protein UreE